MRSLSIALFVSIATTAACGSSSAPRPAHASSQPAPELHGTAQAGEPDADHALCVSLFTQARTCSAEYIPALVGLRVELDHPAGIADTDREIGRDALVAQAFEEWKTDSTDAMIEQTCDRTAPNLSPEDHDRLVAVAEQCIATTDCTAAIECQMAIWREMLAH
jgi:hypothetical protein